MRVACRDTAELDCLLRWLTRDPGVREIGARGVPRSALARGAP